MQNYYELLEVNKNASKETINKVYKLLIKRFHPDLYRENEKKIMEEKLKIINEAYEVLLDDFKREEYDKKIAKEEYDKYEEIFLNKYDLYNKKEEQNNKENLIEDKLTRIESMLNRYDSFLNYITSSNTEIKEDKKKERNKLARIKMIIKKVFVTIGIIAIVGILLYYIPFTKNIIEDVILFLTK